MFATLKLVRRVRSPQGEEKEKSHGKPSEIEKQQHVAERLGFVKRGEGVPGEGQCSPSRLIEPGYRWDVSERTVESA